MIIIVERDRGRVRQGEYVCGGEGGREGVREGGRE